MKNLLDDLGDFDENTQSLLREISNSGRMLNFQERTNSNPFDKVLAGNNSPDFRSKFHDFSNTPLGYSYLTDDPISTFPSTGVDNKGVKG